MAAAADYVKLSLHLTCLSVLYIYVAIRADTRALGLAFFSRVYVSLSRALSSVCFFLASDFFFQVGWSRATSRTRLCEYYTARHEKRERKKREVYVRGFARREGRHDKTVVVVAEYFYDAGL